MNLGRSLLAASERHPGLEAFPGITYAELLPRVARIAGGLGATPGSRVATVLDNRLETALLYWAAQWSGAVFVPLSWRLGDEELDYCITDANAEVVLREGDALPDGTEHPGALDRNDRETSLLLYTSGTTGRPKGVPRSHAADRAGGLGQALHHGYTYSIGSNQEAKPGCAGRPSVNVRLRLADNGEICAELSGDEAFQGYWNRADADARSIREGWYHTGDTGHLDADGDLWIDGRLDDMIISGGENIHPLEVEDVLAAHPGVHEVAVVGAPDDRWGQRVAAVVVGTATLEELDAHCLASSLARFKRPREYRFVEALPKSASGKILRRELRDRGSAAISQFR